MNAPARTPAAALVPLATSAALLACLLIGLPHSGPWFHAQFPEVTRTVYARVDFVTLTLAHAQLALLASAIAVLIGLAAGILATRRGARELLPTVQAVAVIGQTIPPVAVLAIAVPLVGFGAWPTVLALVVYGVLPVLGQTVAGLQQVPASMHEAADGMGYGPWRRLFEMELPLAAGPIMAGVRIASIVAVGTAALGSTVGATTLGAPIIEGLVGNNLPFVIEGASLVGALALFVDALLGLVEAWVRAPRGRRRPAPGAAALVLLVPALWPGTTQAAEPPWHIESFCRRQAPPASRCLVRARQGILTLRLLETRAAPAVHWQGGTAVLVSGRGNDRRWRFVMPPDRISAAYQHVLAFDDARRRVAYLVGGTVHVSAVFAPLGHHDFRHLGDARPDSVRARFASEGLIIDWSDGDGTRQSTVIPLSAGTSHTQ